jgi:zinc-finger of transposase IS204/IS1001/IS1096/IS1165
VAWRCLRQGISAISANFGISSLVPCGLIVESVVQCENTIKVTARSQASAAARPSCGTSSQRVHSRYVRQVADLPCTGRSVSLTLVARRFFCDAEICQRRIFAERFDETTFSACARRTTRLDCIVHYLGLALGGRPAASFARRLMLPESNDTLLRVVRRRARAGTEPLTVVEIDDWVRRKLSITDSKKCLRPER